jgi:hypothetical protein
MQMHVHSLLLLLLHRAMLAHVHRVNVFAEADYLYGVGSLIMRVEHVDWTTPTAYDGEDWYEVRGVELTDDGREVGLRQALVRGRRLRPPGHNQRR